MKTNSTSLALVAAVFAFGLTAYAQPPVQSSVLNYQYQYQSVPGNTGHRPKWALLPVSNDIELQRTQIESYDGMSSLPWSRIANPTPGGSGSAFETPENHHSQLRLVSLSF